MQGRGEVGGRSCAWWGAGAGGDGIRKERR